jgi:hypothetical protein
MRNPDGKECHHYYEDFHRGREIQECRLIRINPDSLRWHPNDCSKCNVPGILQANSDPNLELTVTIKAGLFGFIRRLEVAARCTKHNTPVEDPFIGCLLCNDERPGLNIFRQAFEQSDDD